MQKTTKNAQDLSHLVRRSHHREAYFCNETYSSRYQKEVLTFKKMTPKVPTEAELHLPQMWTRNIPLITPLDRRETSR